MTHKIKIKLLRPNPRLVPQTQCPCTTKLLCPNPWLVPQTQCPCTTKLLRPNPRLVPQTQCPCTTKLLRLNPRLVPQTQCPCTTKLLLFSAVTCLSDCKVVLEEPGVCVESVSTEVFKTKLVTTISKSLESKTSFEHDLKDLDDVRTAIKQGKKSESLITKHQKPLSLFKQRLYQRKRQIRLELSNYENQHYLSKHCLPDRNTYKMYYFILQKYRFTEKLIVSPDLIDI